MTGIDGAETRAGDGAIRLRNLHRNDLDPVVSTVVREVKLTKLLDASLGLHPHTHDLLALRCPVVLKANFGQVLLDYEGLLRIVGGLFSRGGRSQRRLGLAFVLH